MAPFYRQNLQPRDFDLDKSSNAFKAQWTNPSNYAFTILLLLGGDVVARALAQLAGGRITPVAFSFGWVSYATTGINSAIGENKLMPASDTPCMVINADNNQSRSNNAWVLGRAMRDFEQWMGDPVREKVAEVREKKWQHDKEYAQKKGKDLAAVKRPDMAGLVISFWTFDHDKTHNFMRPGKDILFWSGILVTILQLGISAVPFGIYGNWGVFLVTASAITLCFLTGGQAQWKREKWRCRLIEPGKKRTYILTRGNGAQHAIVIQGDGCGLNLEDLCTGFENIDNPSISVGTRLFMVLLGVLWVILLITSSALADQSWFLIAIGGIGMLQNMFVAGWSRNPESLGLPLKFEHVIGNEKVFTTLIEAEKYCAKVGRALQPIFLANIWPKEEAQLAAIERDRGSHGDK